MRTETIIKKLIADQPDFPEVAIRRYFAPGAAYPRCIHCGSPYHVQDMDIDTLYVGCNHHKDETHRIEAYREDYLGQEGK